MYPAISIQFIPQIASRQIMIGPPEIDEHEPPKDLDVVTLKDSPINRIVTNSVADNTSKQNKKSSIMTEHRSGNLKQTNKTHKNGKHKSKGLISTLSKGRIIKKSLPSKKQVTNNRKERRNKAIQKREAQEESIKKTKKLFKSIIGPSTIITLIPLSEHVNIERLKDILQSLTSNSIENLPKSFNGEKTFYSKTFKFKFTLFENEFETFSLLNALKFSDLFMFVVTPQTKISELSDSKVLKALKAVGLPENIFLVQGTNEFSFEEIKKVKRIFQSYIKIEFLHENLFFLNNENEGRILLRHLSNKKIDQLHWKRSHPFVLAENIRYNEEDQKLNVIGYVRGSSISANQLVALPSNKVFQIERIFKAKEQWETNLDIDEQFEEISIPDTELQETLNSEREINQLETEQTWPTPDDFFQNRVNDKKIQENNNCLSSWTSENDSFCSEEDSDISKYFSENTTNENNVDLDEDQTSINDESYDLKNRFEDDCKDYEKIHKRKIKNDFNFPDEVDTPLNEFAKDRFKKYRGLQSFKDTPWDKKEDLPTDYSRIYSISNYNATCKKAMNEPSNNIPEGTYVSIVIKNVSKSSLECYGFNQPFILRFLLRHENKMSLLNISMKRVQENSSIIKSKDTLFYYTPQLIFSGSTLFSEHNYRSSKFKLLRYFHQQQETVISSVYAPIHYQPCPVLVFNLNSDGSHSLLATGKVLSSDPDRIILKRVILRGNFYKINIKSCVLRYMFHNRDDINWFKPIELRSKHGLRGHIQEALGTHGHMKCVMNSKIKSDDVVFMYLYKRVFPKWNFTPLTPNQLNVREESSDNEILDEEMGSVQ